MKYKKTLILLFLSLPLVIIQLFILPNVSSFTNFNIIDTIGGFIVFTYLFILLASIIGGLFVGYALSPLFLFVHKKVIGIKMEYGLQDKNQSNKFKGVLKGFFPGFFAMNIGLLLMTDPVIQAIVLKPGFLGGEIMAQLVTFAALLPILIGIGTGIFSPVWFLLDAGIVYTNKKKVEGTSYPTEVRSVGGWYMYLLKGYAGITVILAFYTFIAAIIQSEVTANPDLTGSILILALWPFMPILMALMALPGMIALDMTFDHRKKYVRNIANRLGINGPLEEPFEFRENLKG